MNPEREIREKPVCVTCNLHQYLALPASLHEIAGGAGAVTGQFISEDLGRNSIEDAKFLP
jgi:hypothetical protein